jgi:hypothetical protein
MSTFYLEVLDYEKKTDVDDVAWVIVYIPSMGMGIQY